ncbi:MAG: polysaccharide deacetylase family protein [Clostridia bacterium]|nr:polysaccharide deacetylase family protein [Clostridia bacterium]
MWNGKKKAITFSFDDGVTQDKSLIAILDRYGLKATFNINSGFFGTKNELIRNGVPVRHDKPTAKQAISIYRNHEIAAHTLTHPLLPKADDAEVIRQVEEDRRALSSVFGRECIGLAYPCGGRNHDSRVETLVREKTGCLYARTIDSTGNFDLPTDVYAWNPTVYYIDTDEMFRLGEKFLAMTPDTPQLFYIWGHAYELDAWNFWERFEDFCRMMSGKDDIFYGTNREVLGI